MNKFIIFIIFFIGLFSYNSNKYISSTSYGSKPIIIHDEPIKRPTVDEPVETPPVEQTTQEYSNIELVDLSKFKAVANMKDGKKIMILTGTTCGYCKAYKPILNEVLVQYGLEAYEIDTWKLNESESKELATIVGNYSGVPTTVIMDSGTVLDTRIGYQEKDSIVEMLKNNGFIN